jgi:hypothetical protein
MMNIMMNMMMNIMMNKIERSECLILILLEQCSRLNMRIKRVTLGLKMPNLEATRLENAVSNSEVFCLNDR